jgi:hypothetical protein
VDCASSGCTTIWCPLIKDGLKIDSTLVTSALGIVMMGAKAFLGKIAPSLPEIPGFASMRRAAETLG